MSVVSRPLPSRTLPARAPSCNPGTCPRPGAALPAQRGTHEDRLCGQRWDRATGTGRGPWAVRVWLVISVPALQDLEDDSQATWALPSSPSHGAECLPCDGLGKGLHGPQAILRASASSGEEGSSDCRCCGQPQLPEAPRGQATCRQPCPARSWVRWGPRASLLSSLSGAWALAPSAV